MPIKKAFSFDERADAESILENGFPDGVIKTGEMYVVAKYLRNTLGLGAVRLEREIIKFCKSQNPNFNPVVEAQSIKKWISSAMTHSLRKITDITITRGEMGTLKLIENNKHRMVLFSCLIISKALKKGGTLVGRKESASQNYYVNYNNISDIISMMKLNLRETDVTDILSFYQDNLLTVYANPERQSIKLNFVDEAGDLVISINDMSKCLDYYNLCFGDSKTSCSVCGNEIVRTNNRQHRCKTCSDNVRREKNKEVKRRSRAVTI